MRLLLALLILNGCITHHNKPPLTFKQVIKDAKEVIIHDSILFDCTSVEKTPLDSITGMKFWEIIYNNEKEMIHNADYSIAGKITSHPKLDILLFFIERASSHLGREYGISKDLYFIILDKNENYKYQTTASYYFDIKRENKITTTEKVSSWLYKDFKMRTSNHLDPGLEEFNYNEIGQITENGIKVTISL